MCWLYCIIPILSFKTVIVYTQTIVFHIVHCFGLRLQDTVYAKAHNEIHFVYVVPRNSINVRTLQTFNVTDVQGCSHSILQLLQTFNVADVQCCYQTFNVATVNMPRSKRFLPPKLNNHVQIMFMHIAVIFILLPQMFCWPATFHSTIFSSSLRLWA